MLLVELISSILHWEKLWEEQQVCVFVCVCVCVCVCACVCVNNLRILPTS